MLEASFSSAGPPVGLTPSDSTASHLRNSTRDLLGIRVVFFGMPNSYSRCPDLYHRSVLAVEPMICTEDGSVVSCVGSAHHGGLVSPTPVRSRAGNHSRG